MGCSISKRSKANTSDDSKPEPAPSTINVPKVSVISPAIPEDHDPDLFVEGVVCKENELSENEMKTFKLGDGEILLVKQNGKVSALGTKCTHYGAPLEKAALGEGRIRCQWHGACFNVANGDIEDFPGMDSLPCHQVTIKNGEISVKANKASILTNKRQPKFCARDFNNNNTYVVVGGGAAGVVCVEQLRKEGFTGRLIFVLGENFLPYDRVKLTKAMNIEHKAIQLRSEDFYNDRNIEIIKGAQLLKIDPVNKKLVLSNDGTIQYDKVLLATGSSARQMQCEGSNLKNIFTLRNIDDAKAIVDAINSESRILIVGSSFIGMEAAATLVDKAATITVLAVEPAPFSMALGSEVGLRVQALFEVNLGVPGIGSPFGLEAAVYLTNKVADINVIGRDEAPLMTVLGRDISMRIQKMFEDKNVKFYNSSTVEKFLGEDKVTGAIIKGPASVSVDADVVILGVGAIPNTQYLGGVDIELKPNKTIPVNEYLETSLENVYAAGDIAHAPILSWEAAIGHWGLAQYHGKLAAHNMMGQKKQIDSVPFFWTVFFGKSFRYCGFAPGYKKVTIKGDLENLSFVAFYSFDDGTVGAILTIGRDPIAAAFSEELRNGPKLHIDHVDSWLAKF